MGFIRLPPRVLLIVVRRALRGQATTTFDRKVECCWMLEPKTCQAVVREINFSVGKGHRTLLQSSHRYVPENVQRKARRTKLTMFVGSHEPQTFRIYAAIDG